MQQTSSSVAGVHRGQRARRSPHSSCWTAACWPRADDWVSWGRCVPGPATMTAPGMQLIFTGLEAHIHFLGYTSTSYWSCMNQAHAEVLGDLPYATCTR